MLIEHISLEQVAKMTHDIPEFELPEARTITYYEKRMNGKNPIAIAAKEVDTYLGYIVGYDHFVDGSFYCWTAGVRTEFRKRGAFAEMMIYLLSWAKDNGYTQIKIKTKNDRREMLTYLVKEGYYIFKIIKEVEDIAKLQILFQKDIV